MMTRPVQAAAIAFAAVVLLFSALGRADLFNPDEPREAEIAREMGASGDAVVPRLNGDPFLEKPPLFYWLVVASYRLAGGPGELTARLIPALAGLLCVLLTWLVGRDLVGERAALLAAAVLLTSFQFFWTARRCMIDMPLTLMVLVACGALHRALGAAGRGRLAWLGGGYLAIGAAVLLKGIVGAGIPALALAGLLAARLDRAALRKLAVVPGVLVALLPVAVWTALLERRLGAAGVREFVWVNNVLRFTGGAAKGHLEPFYYYLPTFLSDFAPWSLLVPFAVAAAWGALRRGEPRHEEEAGREPLLFVLSWFLVPLAVLSIASTKRGIYLLPIYPAAALLVGWWLARLPWPAASRAARAGLGLLFGAAILIGALLLAALHLALPGEPVVAVAASALMLLFGFAGYAALRAGRAGRLACLTAGAVGLAYLGVACGIVPEVVNRQVSPKRTAAQIRRLTEAGDRLALYKFKEGSLGGYLFYAGMTIPHLRTPEELRRHLASGAAEASPRSLVLMREEDYESDAPSVGIPTTTVQRFQGGLTVEGIGLSGSGWPRIVLGYADPMVMVAAERARASRSAVLRLKTS